MSIPVISLKQLHDQRALARRFAGKIVFAGVIAQTAVKDRWPTPYSPTPMAGVEILANAYETIAQQQFLTSAPGMVRSGILHPADRGDGSGLRLVLGTVALHRGTRNSGRSTCPAISSLHAKHRVSVFTRRIDGVADLCDGGGMWQHLYVRRRLVKSEGERDRYQHAMQFVTHEMRTPLTAIQGSSELMSRYAMTEEKRKQIAQLIHSESKRLGRMIEMFLNVERLSAGEVELKKESFSVRAIMAGCVERAAPLAERKQIRMHHGRARR